MFYLVDHDREFAMLARACTADLVTYRLDPGESRSFSLEWNGLVYEGNEKRTVDPGSYQVVGVAGDYGSAPLSISLLSWR
jgi:hypothetical protein